MKKDQTRKKKGIIASVILFFFSAVFLIYGIYMLAYSADYVRTYMETSSVSGGKAVQYVLTSSLDYFGFAALLFGCGFIIILTDSALCRKNGMKTGAESDITHHIHSSGCISNAENACTENVSDDRISYDSNAEADNDTDTYEKPDAHPENNPYYTAECHTAVRHDKSEKTNDNPADKEEYHIRPELTSKSWVKDAFSKR